MTTGPTAGGARTPAEALELALARDSSRPLLTFYDDATGERTELSVATFANWVAKTANLVQDEYDLAPGSLVAVDLPLHWQSAVWYSACWALRLVAIPPGTPTDRPVDLAVVESAQDASDAPEVVALGLGPMGLARPGHVPAYQGALDYDREVHGHGDRFVPHSRADTHDPALAAGGRALTGGELVEAARAADPVPGGGRVLVTAPLGAPAVVVAAVLVPLVTGTTAVLCRNLDRDRLRARTQEEDLTAALVADGATAGTVPAWRPVHPASPRIEG